MPAESGHTSLTRMEAFSSPTFTGKERDEETGYGYFGARYMDHELMTMWLSVDPMADKYPNISPYAYCAWSPVKIVDPNGKEIVIKDGKNIYYYKNNHVYFSNNRCALQMDDKLGTEALIIKNNLDIISNDKAGKKVIKNLVENTNQTYIISADAEKGEGNYDAINNKVSLVAGEKNNLTALSHELFHAYQDNMKRTPHTIYNEVEAYVFCGVISGRSLGMTSDNNMEYHEKGIEFVRGLMNGKSFDCDSFQYFLDNFKCSTANQKGTYNNYKKGNTKACDSLLKELYQ